ncbi:DUF4126 domain-containing protein [Sphingomonas suaedae]|uniref:DUF4126 domain-containing protein n=1 Tax=Sphingomonas suaedae TaxID=2599297 RepID=A0A518REZ2_9SPHN|nr:DUF4126 domain-containing protein [Sphingomonas suaedae]QDX25989.1 DUF4126 domain-containing protein [Sphingomonas suaedae]
MLRSILLGLVAGSRAMTPLAAVANAARTGRLPRDSAAPPLLAHPLISAGTGGLALLELVGDKQDKAGDRIVTPAVVVRTLNAAFAGAMLAPRRRRLAAAAVAGTAAAAASYVSWRMRKTAMERHSQATTGLVEDAIVVPTAIAAATAR